MSGEHRRYTCMNCNKGYALDDPQFDYFKRYGANHWAVKAGLVKDGDRMMGLEGVHPESGKPFKLYKETYGWFARCADPVRCARYRRANHAGLNYGQQELFNPEVLA